MKIVLFCHSLVSDWDHGNAHFLRGLVCELAARGHEVVAYEPRDGWSASNLLEERLRAGQRGLPIAALDAMYPGLRAASGGVVRYGPEGPDLDQALDGADLVLVHEWTDPALVGAIGKHRARGARYHLLFHDTHHRSVSAPEALAKYDLSAFDGVLAFGAAVARAWEAHGWGRRVWVWHEAADADRFCPFIGVGRERAAVFVGNWGDEERTAELRTFLLDPVAATGLPATVHGVRWPQHAIAALRRAGATWCGFLPNYDVPMVYARHTVAVHIPRRPYAKALPGIPTIRVFEALACGIPLVCAPWDDVEGLFVPGEDFLVARTGDEMARHLRAVTHDRALALALARSGRRRIVTRHTVAHRVDELFAIVDSLSGSGRPPGRVQARLGVA
jgi:spore maturation protein CgeB